MAEVCGSVVYLLDTSSKESITSFFTEHEIKFTNVPGARLPSRHFLSL